IGAPSVHVHYIAGRVVGRAQGTTIHIDRIGVAADVNACAGRAIYVHRGERYRPIGPREVDACISGVINRRAGETERRRGTVNLNAITAGCGSTNGDVSDIKSVTGTA